MLTSAHLVFVSGLLLWLLSLFALPKPIQCVAGASTCDKASLALVWQPYLVPHTPTPEMISSCRSDSHDNRP